MTARTNKELARFLYQLAENSGDAMLRQAAQRLEAIDRPREGLCGDLRIAGVVLREAGYPSGADACMAAAIRLDIDEATVRRAATAIANERGGRRGAPAIVNILDVLEKLNGGKLYDEVMEDARAALEAALSAQKTKEG